MARDTDYLARCAALSGPLPERGGRVGAESFWAGYSGMAGVRKGIPGSAARRYYMAGLARAEPGLTATAILMEHKT